MDHKWIVKILTNLDFTFGEVTARTHTPPPPTDGKEWPHGSKPPDPLSPHRSVWGSWGKLVTYPLLGHHPPVSVEDGDISWVGLDIQYTNNDAHTMAWVPKKESPSYTIMLWYYDRVHFISVLRNELNTVKNRKKRMNGTMPALNKSLLEIPRSLSSNML